MMGIKWITPSITFLLLLVSSIHAQTKAPPAELARWVKHQQTLLANPDVVAYYDFQGGQGTTLKNKSKTGAALDGKIRGAQWVAGRWPGKNALHFDGSKSQVEIPSLNSLCALDQEQGGTGEITVEVWLKAMSTKEAGIVDKSSAGTATHAPYMIWISPHRLNSYIGKQSENRLTSVSDVEDILTQEWIHVAMVVNSEALALYRDGILLGRAPRNAKVSDNGKPLLLGSMGLAGRYFFDGLIDEVVIYKKALPESVIKKHAELFPEATGPQTITLTSPQSGERWNAGTLHDITWTATNARKAGLLQIEYSVDDGKSWKMISTTAVKAQKYLWRVPKTVSNDCRVRLMVNQRIDIGQKSDLFAIQPAPEIPEYEWKKVALPAAFAPRDGAGALVFQDQMWLLGGWNPPDKTFFPRACNNEVWKSKNGADWKLVRPNTFKDRSFDPQLDWEGRHTAGYVVYKDKMWIVGGDANQGHYQFDVWNSSDGKSWNYVNKGKPVPWGPRVLHYTLVFNDRIWVMGGQSLPQIGGGKEVFYRDIWNTTDGINWTQVTPQEPFWPQRGMIGGNVVFKDRMWILGGGTYDTPQTPQRKYFNDVWSSEDGVKWQSHSKTTPWEPRQYHEVAAFDGRMWVLEGYARGNRNDVWHSDDGVNWYEIPDTPWKPRHAASVYVFNNALWMVAGNNMQSDVWKLVRTDQHK
ncbi:MAG: LamG domain-containing protein [Gimesia sp.]|nr:LamG domain-containing protein [Gimesia sp.]